jgi:hypothetical protein
VTIEKPRDRIDGAMPRYLIVRNFSVVEDEMPKIGRRSRQIVENELPAITWEHSHVVVHDDGKVSTYCIYAAPDEETVREHSVKLGSHNIQTLVEIAGDVTPADFPD